jgi:hypothetical protein
VLGKETPQQEGNAVRVHHKRLRLLACAALVLTILLPITARSADTSGGQRICDGPYALCSSAKCQAIDDDPSHVKCTCEGPLQGLNIANSSCQERTDQLTSTFSLWDPTATGHKPAKSSLACTGSNAGKWAFCLDAPCNVEKGTVSCRCQLNPASEYYTFINVCPVDGRSLRAACAEIWSAASQTELLSGFSQLTPFYGNPPKLAYCPANTAGSPAAR